jgi:hypothetical protein
MTEQMKYHAYEKIYTTRNDDTAYPCEISDACLTKQNIKTNIIFLDLNNP